MEKLNADRIIWTGNTLNELRDLLGGDIEIEFEEEILDSEILDFPWPITVKSVDVDTTRGDTSVDVTITFDGVDGAETYEVRFSPVAEDSNPVINTNLILSAFKWNNAGEWVDITSTVIDSSDATYSVVGQGPNAVLDGPQRLTAVTFSLTDIPVAFDGYLGIYFKLRDTGGLLAASGDMTIWYHYTSDPMNATDPLPHGWNPKTTVTPTDLGGEIFEISMNALFPIAGGVLDGGAFASGAPAAIGIGNTADDVIGEYEIIGASLTLVA